MITTETVVARDGDLVEAPLGDEVAMMDARTGKYFVLDATGAFIWDRVRKPCRVDDLVRDLQELYDVAPARCEDDVVAFLTRLHAHALVRTVA